METSCFLTSKPLPKRSLLSPPLGLLKPKLLLPSKRRLSSSSTCCSFSALSSSDDGAPPKIGSDWRSFRARLYFNEQSLAASTNGTAGPAPAPAQPAKMGTRWAHPLEEPEKGCLLIATDKLDGSHIFERTVVLLLSTGVLGPVGVILNRPSLMSIKEAQSGGADAFAGRPLFFGGPLEEFLFLVGPRAGSDVVSRTGVFEEVMEGVHYGSREGMGCAAEMVRRGVVEARDFRFFDGFCGWGREQLREEVRSGMWRVAACSSAVLGLAGAVKGGLWEEVQGLVGGRKVW